MVSQLIKAYRQLIVSIVITPRHSTFRKPWSTTAMQPLTRCFNGIQQLHKQRQRKWLPNLMVTTRIERYRETRLQHHGHHSRLMKGFPWLHVQKASGEVCNILKRYLLHKVVFPRVFLRVNQSALGTS